MKNFWLKRNAARVLMRRHDRREWLADIVGRLLDHVAHVLAQRDKGLISPDEAFQLLERYDVNGGGEKSPGHSLMA